MTPIQPALDGTIPPAATADYDAWVDAVRPVFVEAARTGRVFMFWQIQQKHPTLPAPPDPSHDPGRLAAALHRERIIRTAGHGQTRDGSSVRRWRGTRAVIEGKAA